MDLGSLLDNTNYCVGATERGAGVWTYQTLTGAQIKANWHTAAFREALLVGSCPNVPVFSKWSPVQLPDGQWIVVRPHLGAVVPDVVARAWPSVSEYRKTGRRPRPVVAPVVTPEPDLGPDPAVVDAVEDTENEVQEHEPQSVASVLDAAAYDFASLIHRST